MPLFYKIIQLDEYKSGIASRLFVPETKIVKTKVQLVNHERIVISYASISLMPLFGETKKNDKQIGN